MLATGAMNEAMWLLADLDLAQIARVRAEGQVYNYRDWARQFDSDVIGHRARAGLAGPRHGYVGGAGWRET
ncbi:MAG: hypothetical protein R2838_06915 [Caldilineaceae bacterium]